MKFLGAIILAALFLLAVFTLANWAVLTASTTLSFIVFDIQGPLGVVLLGVTLALVGLLALYALSIRTAMLMESRHHNQEMQAQRKLAESAEASRLNDLRVLMEREFVQTRGMIEQSGEHMEKLEQAIRKSFDETANGLAAHIGEFDDKLDQILARSNNSY